MKTLDCPVCDLPMIQGIDGKKRPYGYCPPCGARFFVGRLEAVKKYEARFGTSYKGDAEPDLTPTPPPKPAPKAKAAPAATPTPAPALPTPEVKEEPARAKRRVTFFD